MIFIILFNYYEFIYEFAYEFSEFIFHVYLFIFLAFVHKQKFEYEYA